MESQSKRTKLRGIISGFFVIIIMLFLISGWLFGEQTAALSHPVWSGFFLLLFVWLLCGSITYDLQSLAEEGIKNSLLRIVPKLDLGTVVNVLLLLLFIIPAYWITGRFVFRLVHYFISPTSANVEEEITLWFSFFPLVDIANGGAQSGFTFLTGDLVGCWSAAIGVAYGMIVVFAATVLISIPAKLLTGTLSGSSIFCRILVGFAMVVYALYLPGWLMEKVNGSFLDLQGVQNVFFAIDGLSGLKLIGAYLLLAVVTAVACSGVVWTIFSLLAFAAAMGILFAIFPVLEQVFHNEILQLALFFGLTFYIFGTQVWGMVPTDD